VANQEGPSFQSPGQSSPDLSAARVEERTTEDKLKYLDTEDQSLWNLTKMMMHLHPFASAGRTSSLRFQDSRNPA
jgi:hypothetical protein